MMLVVHFIIPADSGGDTKKASSFSFSRTVIMPVLVVCFESRLNIAKHIQQCAHLFQVLALLLVHMHLCKFCG